MYPALQICCSQTPSSWSHIYNWHEQFLTFQHFVGLYSWSLRLLDFQKKGRPLARMKLGNPPHPGPLPPLCCAPWAESENRWPKGSKLQRSARRADPAEIRRGRPDGCIAGPRPRLVPPRFGAGNGGLSGIGGGNRGRRGRGRALLAPGPKKAGRSVPERCCQK